MEAFDWNRYTRHAIKGQLCSKSAICLNVVFIQCPNILHNFKCKNKKLFFLSKGRGVSAEIDWCQSIARHRLIQSEDSIKFKSIKGMISCWNME